MVRLRAACCVVALSIGVMTTACDRVFGLDEVGPTSCVGVVASLCADFDTFETGLAQFQQSQSTNGSLTEFQASKPRSSGVLSALISTSMVGSFTIASVSRPASATGFRLELDVNAAMIGTCSTSFAYLDFPIAAGSFVHRAFLTSRPLGLDLTVTDQAGTISTMGSIPIDWSTGWYHLTFVVDPDANLVSVDTGTTTLDLVDLGLGVVASNPLSLKIGATGPCAAEVQLDSVVLRLLP